MTKPSSGYFNLQRALSRFFHDSSDYIMCSETGLQGEESSGDHAACIAYT